MINSPKRAWSVPHRLTGFEFLGSHAMDETRNSIFAIHMDHGMVAYANSLVIDHLQMEGVKFSQISDNILETVRDTDNICIYDIQIISVCRTRTVSKILSPWLYYNHGRIIGNHTWLIEWLEDQWPSVTSKVTYAVGNRSRSRTSVTAELCCPGYVCTRVRTPECTYSLYGLTVITKLKVFL